MSNTIQVQIQETVSKAKQRYLTFEEICPRWSLQLSGLEQAGIDINDYESCIVGEAHVNNGTSYMNIRKR